MTEKPSERIAAKEDEFSAEVTRLRDVASWAQEFLEHEASTIGEHVPAMRHAAKELRAALDATTAKGETIPIQHTEQCQNCGATLSMRCHRCGEWYRTTAEAEAIEEEGKGPASASGRVEPRPTGELTQTLNVYNPRRMEEAMQDGRESRSRDAGEASFCSQTAERCPSVAQFMRGTEASTARVVAQYTEALERNASRARTEKRGR